MIVIMVTIFRYTFNGLKVPPGAACARGSPAQVQTVENYVDNRVVTSRADLLTDALGISLASRRGISPPIYCLWAGV